MKRVLSLLLFLLFLCTGCSGKHQETETATDTGAWMDIVVGFSQLGAESSWRIANTESIRSAAQAYGYGLMMDNANQKQEKQIAAIRSFIAYRVDVIVFSPIVENGWDHVLKEARQAEIPVILVDRMIETEDESLYTAYVGADFYLEGQRAGAYLKRKADKAGLTHLNIIEISGTIDSTPMRDRHAGFMDEIAGDERFTVIESLSGDFLRSKGAECMRELLKKHNPEEIDVIYSHNDSMTLGIMDVLEEAGIHPGEDIIMISVDGEKAAVDALKEGKINCIVQCSPHLGDAVMQLVQDLTAGREVPKISHPMERVFSDLDDDAVNRGVEGF